MLVGLYRKRLESPLIHGPGPRRVMMRMPALHMGDGDPAQHFRELAIMARPEQQVPLIGHQTICGDSGLGLGVGFGQNLLKSGVVSRLLKQGEAPDTTIQDVISEISCSEERAAWYSRPSTETAALLSKVTFENWILGSICTTRRLQFRIRMPHLGFQ